MLIMLIHIVCCGTKTFDLPHSFESETHDIRGELHELRKVVTRLRWTTHVAGMHM
jgi:hypothetical protein